MSFNKIIRMLLTISLLLCFSKLNNGAATARADCQEEQVSIVPRGSTASISTVVAGYSMFNQFEFHRISPVNEFLFYLYVYVDSNATEPHMKNIHALYKDRVSVKASRENGTITYISLTVSDIGSWDNGSFILRRFPLFVFCWSLFVMELKPMPSPTVEENNSIKIYGYPRASQINRQIVNASMVWLYDGLLANKTAKFIEQNGFIWIANVKREMAEKNVTYRAIQDNGEVSEVNFTLDVTYNTSETIAIEVLAIVQTITGIVLSVCIIYVFLKLRGIPCSMPGIRRERLQETSAQEPPVVDLNEITTEIGQYEDLNAQTRAAVVDTHYGQINHELSDLTADNSLKVYENTDIKRKF